MLKRKIKIFVELFLKFYITFVFKFSPIVSLINNFYISITLQIHVLLINIYTHLVQKFEKFQNDTQNEGVMVHEIQQETLQQSRSSNINF